MLLTHFHGHCIHIAVRIHSVEINCGQIINYNVSNGKTIGNAELRVYSEGILLDLALLRTGEEARKRQNKSPITYHD